MAMAWADTHGVRHGSNAGWVLGYGILLTIIGLFALMEPIATGLATGFLIAFVLIVTGIMALIAGASLRGWHSRWLDIVIGVLAILVGTLALWHPFLAAFSLVWFIGVWLFLSGISELFAGFGAASHKWPLVLLGAVDVLLGLYLFFSGPLTALFALAVLVGFSFVMRGVMLIVLGLRLRRAAA